MSIIQIAIEAAGNRYGYSAEADFDTLKQKEAAIEVGRVVLDTVDVAHGGVGVLVGTVTVKVGGGRAQMNVTPDYFEGSRLEKGVELGNTIISAAYALSEEGN